MQCFVSWEVASKANKWLGKNAVRWQSSEFDALFQPCVAGEAIWHRCHTGIASRSPARGGRGRGRGE